MNWSIDLLHENTFQQMGPTRFVKIAQISASASLRDTLLAIVLQAAHVAEVIPAAQGNTQGNV